MSAPSRHRFDPDERQRFARDGYVVRRDVFSRDESGRIADASERLVARLIEGRQASRIQLGSYVFDPDTVNDVIIKWEGDSDVVHGIEPFAHLCDELRATALDERFTEPMIDILGVDAPELFTEKLNLKRPRSGGANPLHQDYPYWVPVADDASQIATAMLFLDDADIDNGCLNVVAGSHLDGVWAGRDDSDAFGANEIDSSRHADAELEALEVPAGSVVFFGPLLVHQSAPNTSSRQRRAILFSYQPPGRTTQLQALRKRFGKSP